MKRICLLMLVVLLQACGGGGGGYTSSSSGGPTQPQSCSIADQRAAVLAFMREEYFWNTQLGTPDVNAPTMDAYFQSLLFRPTDRFSFSETTAAYQQLFQEGTFTGYGYSFVFTDATQSTLRVRTVEPKGPAAAAGLKRGDTIITIDGYTAQDIAAGAPVGAVPKEGIPRTIHARDVSGADKTIDMISATFPLTQVRDVKVLTATRNGQPVKVGYLDYNQFVTYSVNDLTAAVSGFVAQGATELVIDLRYNGGGDIATSRDLASMVAGARVAGQVFAGLRFNADSQFRNADYRFNQPAASIQNLSRVFILASGGTASASELVINGLKPFMNVVLIGETTYGKPYGFEPLSYCGTTYNAVNFDVVNSAGVGGYTSGFAPTCPVPDDLDHQLGDPNEARLKTALNYIATGACPQSPQSAPLVSRPLRVFGDVVPPGMFRR